MGHRLELPVDQVNDLIVVEGIKVCEPVKSLVLGGADGGISLGWG